MAPTTGDLTTFSQNTLQFHNSAVDRVAGSALDVQPMTRRLETPLRPGRVPRRLVALLLVALVATAPLLAATAKDLYTAALTREHEIRAPADDPPTLAQLRDAMAAYTDIVRQYPRSGYSDNALWQAAGLAIWAFERARQPADREAGARLLHTLEREYPSSSLVPRVADRLAQLSQHDAPVRIRAIRREPLADIVRVTIELDGEARYSAERLDGPARLFFDFSATDAPSPLRNATLAFDDGHVVREIRLGRHPEQTTRVVLDIEDVDSYNVYSLYDPYRLIVDTVPAAFVQARRATLGTPPSLGDTGPPPTDLGETRSLDPIPPIGTAPAALSVPDRAPPPAPTPDVLPQTAGELTWPRVHDILYPDLGAPPSLDTTADVQASEGTGPADELVSVTPLFTREVAMPATRVFPMPMTDVPPRREARAGTGTPTANSNGDFSLDRQLGLGVWRVVIDPGHGGYDPGAQTGALTESALVLDIALRLEARLTAETGLETVLTRRSDAYVPLRARTELANRVGADLFLSIHANAARDPRARGVETYHLNLTTDPTAQSVAARENAASRQGMHALPQLLQSLTMHNKRDESRDFATRVQSNLVGAVRQVHPGVQDLGVKQAPFVVLIGANMPSVLAEISFLTNQEDAAFLATDNYRDLIADALLQSIVEYQRALKPPTNLATENK